MFTSSYSSPFYCLYCSGSFMLARLFFVVSSPYPFSSYDLRIYFKAGKYLFYHLIFTFSPGLLLYFYFYFSFLLAFQLFVVSRYSLLLFFHMSSVYSSAPYDLKIYSKGGKYLFYILYLPSILFLYFLLFYLVIRRLRYPLLLFSRIQCLQFGILQFKIILEGVNVCFII